MSDTLQTPDPAERWRIIGEMPRIDLRQIFPNMDSVDARIDDIAGKSTSIHEKYSGKLDSLAPKAFKDFLTAAEEIEGLSRSISQFCSLLRDMHSGNHDAANQIAARLEMAEKPWTDLKKQVPQMPEGHLLDLANDPMLERYRASLIEQAEISKRRPETYDTAHRTALWAEEREQSRLYSKLRDEVATLAEQPAARATAVTERLDAFAAILVERQRRFRTWQKLEGFEKPLEMPCRSNQIPPEAIESLAEVVQNNLSLRHDFWRWRAEREGKSQLNYMETKLLDQDEKIHPWSYGSDLVIRAFTDFSPEAGRMAASFFTEGRIDAVPAFCRTKDSVHYPSNPHSPPYILLNYYGTNTNIKSGGHEIGHVVHDLMASAQNIWMRNPNLLMAETVALFGERLVKTRMLKDMDSGEENDQFKAASLETDLSKIYSTMALHEFEMKLYNASVDGNISGNDISRLWADTQRKYGGGTVSMRDEERHDWTTCEILFRSNLYNHSYGFAGLVSSYLWEDYQQRGDAFVSDFTELMRAGKSKSPEDLLKPFGVRALDKDFWEKCLQPLKEEMASLLAEHSGPATATRTNPSLPAVNPPQL